MVCLPNAKGCTEVGFARPHSVNFLDKIRGRLIGYFFFMAASRINDQKNQRIKLQSASHFGQKHGMEVIKTTFFPSHGKAPYIDKRNRGIGNILAVHENTKFGCYTRALQSSLKIR